MHHVSGSASTSTGVQPASMTAMAHEIIVKDGRMISEPGSSCRAATATCNAVVPLETATPYFTPQKFAHFSSNDLRYAPSEEIHPEAMQSFTYSVSRPSKRGSFTGIIICA